MKKFNFQRDVTVKNLRGGEVYNHRGVNIFYACGFCVGYFGGCQKFPTLNSAKNFIKTLI